MWLVGEQRFPHLLFAGKQDTGRLPPNPPCLSDTASFPTSSSASNKTRILDMGGKEILLTLSRSKDQKIRQQATKALANLEPDVSARK